MLMTDANENIWERRWFVLRRCARCLHCVITLLAHIQWCLFAGLTSTCLRTPTRSRRLA